MKIVAFGKKNRNNVLLNNGKTEDWYFVSDRAKFDVNTLSVGQDIDVVFEESEKPGKYGQKGKFITSITTTGTSPTPVIEKKPFVPYSGKSQEEQNSIKRQAIGHMVSRTIIGLQGSVDINNVTSVIDTLYKKYVEVVG